LEKQILHREYLRDAALILIVAVLLMGCAFYNRYPLFNSDSGSYIANGFAGFIAPFDRPVFYSWFLRHTSLAYSLWYAVLAQCLLLAYTILRVSKLFLRKPRRRVMVALILLLVCLSCVGWYSGQLMADIFTSILALSFINFLLQKRGARLDAAIVFFAALTHNSNLISLSCACMLLLVLRTFIAPSINLRRLLIGLAISVLAWLTTMSYHAALGYGFTASRSAPLFLMGKMCENGMLREYLKDACPTENYRICQYRDELPSAGWEFIWSDHGPVSKLGGMEGNADEYKRIVKGSLRRPKFLGMHVLKAVEGTVMQLGQLDAGVYFPALREDSSPYGKVRDYYGHELPEYLNSRQNRAELHLDPLDWIYAGFLLLSSVAALMIIRPGEDNRALRTAYVLLLIFIVCNAFATASFANVLGRLNSRLVWTISLFNLFLICRELRGFMDRRRTVAE
jgi:hypothetical protein